MNRFFFSIFTTGAGNVFCRAFYLVQFGCLVFFSFFIYNIQLSEAKYEDLKLEHTHIFVHSASTD
jgi:hypothetical protein